MPDQRSPTGFNLTNLEAMDSYWKQILAGLSEHFPSEWIHWRVGSTSADKKRGLPLAYIDARDVMDRLDQVVGPGKWRDFLEDRGTICIASVQIYCPYRGEWITRSDGAGAPKFEPEKGKLSDAFKRAAVKWGIGRYLYGVNSPWVQIEPAGRSFKIAEREVVRLRAFLDALRVNARPTVEEILELPSDGEEFMPEEPAGIMEDVGMEPPSEFSRPRPQVSITEKQAKALLAECRTVGEGHDVHGFEVCNWTLKELGMDRPGGRPTYGDYLDHLCGVLGPGDFEAFKEMAGKFEPAGF